MSIYAISDLHLPLGVDKSMDIFGYSWENYVQRLHNEWQRLVQADDLVLIPGDLSWATYLDQAYEDFKFLNELKGIKLISKGNHDYWWETLTKIKSFVAKNNFINMHFLHNTAYLYNDTAICAARGWLAPSDVDFGKDDEKIYLRELIRLEISITEAVKFNPGRIICMTHFPPKDGFADLLKKYGIETKICGHIHNAKSNPPDTLLVSADFLKFCPLKI